MTQEDKIQELISLDKKLKFLSKEITDKIEAHPEGITDHDDAYLDYV